MAKGLFGLSTLLLSIKRCNGKFLAYIHYTRKIATEKVISINQIRWCPLTNLHGDFNYLLSTNKVMSINPTYIVILIIYYQQIKQEEYQEVL